MKVSELIDLLSELDPEKEIVIQDPVDINYELLGVEEDEETGYAYINVIEEEYP